MIYFTYKYLCETLCLSALVANKKISHKDTKSQRNTKMNKTNNFIFASIFGMLGLIMMVTSCTERIDVKLDSDYVRLVVEGYITTDTTTHYVKLSKTSDYFSDQKAPRVSGAIVSISDGSSTFQLSETESGSGIYATTPDVHGVVGNTYTLNIDLPEEIDGSTLYTATSEIHPVNTIDSIEVKYEEDWYGWVVQLYAQDPPSTEFYMFNIYKNGDHLTDTINKVGVTDDLFFNGNYTMGIGVAFLDEEKPREFVHPNDTVLLQMASITEGYYNFVWQVQEQTGYQAPLFSGPPANIIGNISNGAIGYFAAYSTTYSSVVAQ